MSLVFVHGIGNRSGTDSYQESVDLRSALFRRFLLTRALPDLAEARIFNPMWGDLGAHLRWQHSSLPRGSRERLGADDRRLAELADVLGERSISELAHADLRDAVDLLYTVADLRGRSAAEIEDLADLAAALVDYCDTQQATPAWLSESIGDEAMLDGLHRAGAVMQTDDRTERLGHRSTMGRLARDVLSAGIARYRRQQLGAPARLAAAGLRRLVAEPVSLLIGDVFCYLDSRGTKSAPGKIVQRVTADLDAARVDGPLVIVAHSMGGNIVYDILSSFRTDLEVDLLVTVGSQVGLFEELSLFRASDRSIPNAAAPRVPALPNVHKWINIVDRADVLAYRADPIFAGPVDYEYPTDEPWAHTAYFRQPYFHQRLAARAKEALT
ncbi:hypothetical protein ACFFX1_34100 [Dactylosporangium sucinum]|uniref:Alpha/beta hydrolase n=1 Tax=Dactylosporangium sucinum TaxID=1424081 RepID=A0A917X7Q9_9ACTN|nr:hypothetical protein [Dactylosporangium sucinum]GGM86448.1 hypothetical protein GCM10007977_105430 [Dactylosporangium sucinum]